MMYNISPDPATRGLIYRVVGIIFVALAIYSVIWIKKVMKIKLFKPLSVEQVMAMENDMYRLVRKKKKKSESIPIVERAMK